MKRFILIVGFLAASSVYAAPSTPDASNEDDPNITTDYVDKPIPNPIVTSQPAPADVEAADNEEAESELTKAGQAPPDGLEIKLKPAPSAKSIPATKQAPAAKPAPAPKSAAAAKATSPIVKEKAAPSAPSADVSAEQSLKWLANGNARFVKKHFRADGRSAEDRLRTSKEQRPHAIILACSDSRVPPELLFDQGLGEITTIRVAGEVLDSSVLASLETAIQNQHPHLLVVLGHTKCESIEAALNAKESLGSEALDKMVTEIKPHLRSLAPDATRSVGLQVESVLQADGVARDLVTRSEIIKKAVESGDLKIKTGLYWIETGLVKFY